MGIIDIEALSRKRAINLAKEGNNGPAIKAQEALLAKLIGLGENVLDAPVVNPRDPIKGLWDSLDRAAKPGSRLSHKTQDDISHTEDGGESYTLVLCERVVRVNEKLQHLKGASIDFISFKDGNKHYLKLLGRYKVVGEDAIERSSYLYERANDGTWKRKDFAENEKEIWSVGAKTRRDFLIAAALRNIHRNSISATCFYFSPEPPRRDASPSPKRLIA